MLRETDKRWSCLLCPSRSDYRQPLRPASPDGGGTTVPLHQGRDVAKGTLRSIFADTQLTIEQLRQLL